MANKNFNTQIRKKFDSGSGPIKRGDLGFKTPAQKSHEKLKKQFKKSDYNITSAGGTKKTKLKDMMDRNPNRTMDAKTKKKLRDAMEKRRQFSKKKNLERQENKKEKTGKAKQPIGKPPLKKETLRKPSEKKQRELRRVKELERKQFGKSSEDKKPRINKLKDKINKIGDMKVKDAAKVVGKAALATTPIGLVTNAAKSVNKNFKFQSPIVSRKDKKFGGK
jgi:hypothetical protein